MCWVYEEEDGDDGDEKLESRHSGLLDVDVGGSVDLESSEWLVPEFFLC